MPSQIRSAGPSRVARPAVIETTRSPPGIRTRTGLELQPLAVAAAATATADDPDAAVSPAPRSHTSTETTSLGSGARKLDVRPPREPWVRLYRGAEAVEVVARERIRRTTACGLPTSTGTIVSRSPATSSTSSSATDTLPRSWRTTPLRPPRVARTILLSVSISTSSGRSREGATPRRCGCRCRTARRSSRRDSRCGSQRGLRNDPSPRGGRRCRSRCRRRRAAGCAPVELPRIGLLHEQVRVAECVPLLEPHSERG